MNFEDWEEILEQNNLDDVLTETDYNEDYSVAIPLTIKEIREIANVLKTSFSNQVEKPVILELAGKLKTSEIENELQKYLEDKQVYDNYKRSFMLPDDAEIVSRYVGIFIRTILEGGRY